MLDFYEKQREFLKAPLHRINILEGSVRSGKTFVSLFAWSNFVALMPADAEFIMVGKTLTSLKRNILELLLKIVGEKNFHYSMGQKEGRLWGRKIYLEGANDERSEGKIRGMTLSGAYCDEITLWAQSFWAMLLSRLSEHNAKLIGTTNPDNPFHWLYTEYLDRPEVNIYNPHFTIYDNTFLDQNYVKSLEQEYVGMYYRRFILGQRVAANGIIYDMFSEDKNVYTELPIDMVHRRYKRYISIDYGTTNPCVFLEIIDDCQGHFYVDREYYFDSNAKNTMRQKEDVEYVADLKAFIKQDNLQSVLVDPTATSFKIAARKRGIRTKDADNDVLNGIRLVSSLFAQGKLLINKRCVNLRKELGSYVWDSKKSETGEEAPVKKFDHACDALRYYCKTIVRG